MQPRIGSNYFTLVPPPPPPPPLLAVVELLNHSSSFAVSPPQTGQCAVPLLTCLTQHSPRRLQLVQNAAAPILEMILRFYCCRLRLVLDLHLGTFTWVHFRSLDTMYARLQRPYTHHPSVPKDQRWRGLLSQGSCSLEQSPRGDPSVESSFKSTHFYRCAFSYSSDLTDYFKSFYLSCFILYSLFSSVTFVYFCVCVLLGSFIRCYINEVYCYYFLLFMCYTSSGELFINSQGGRVKLENSSHLVYLQITVNVFRKINMNCSITVQVCGSYTDLND